MKELLQVPLENLLPLKGQSKQSQGAHLSSQEAVTAKPDLRHHHKKARGAEGPGDAEARDLQQLPSPVGRSTSCCSLCTENLRPWLPALLQPSPALPRGCSFGRVYKLVRGKDSVPPALDCAPSLSGGNAWEVTVDIDKWRPEWSKSDTNSLHTHKFSVMDSDLSI